MHTLTVNGLTHQISDSALTMSLLDVLREELNLRGTKEGCASGDCGACTVIVRSQKGDVSTLNSCITPVGAVADSSVLTVEGLSSVDEPLHPVQTAMMTGHGAQCGFCTPGFVMSMVADQLVRSDADAPLRDDVVLSIGGNLCRCTGYRPIIDAGLAAWASEDRASANEALVERLTVPISVDASPSYQRPGTLDELAEAVQAGGHDATIVAGSTDLWLRVTQAYEDFDTLIDITGMEAWRGVEVRDGVVEIGAATTHAELLRFFEGLPQYSAVVDMLHRFGSPQIRARGTLGGNLANGSPVADWPPILLALSAEIELTRPGVGSRWLPIREFYLGYRTTALENREFLSRVRFVALNENQSLHVYKISKRLEDDISSVLGAFLFDFGDQGVINSASAAFGGMAATPLLVAEIADALLGLTPGQADEAALASAVRQVEVSLKPIGDVRASGLYRTAMVVEMIRRAVSFSTEVIDDVR